MNSVGRSVVIRISACRKIEVGASVSIDVLQGVAAAAVLRPAPTPGRIGGSRTQVFSSW
jgi:hypothetical protein